MELKIPDPQTRPVPVETVVLLPEVVKGEERHGLIISGVAQHEGDPPGVGEVAPVGAARLTQLSGVVTEDNTAG